MPNLKQNSLISYIQNGDLFKILKMRYPESLYTDEGSVKFDNLPSICIELINWFKTSESFIKLLLDQLSTSQSLEEFKEFVDQNSYQLQVEDSRIEPDSRFEVPTVYKKMKEGFNGEFLPVRDINGNEDVASLLSEWKEADRRQKAQLKENFSKSVRHYNLDAQVEDIYDELLETIRTTSQCYVLCLDVVIEQNLKRVDAYHGWEEQLFCYRNILKKAFETSFAGTNNCQRFYLKSEVINRFDFRFHFLILLNPISLKESDWLENLEVTLTETLTNRNLLKQWYKELQAEVNLKSKESFDNYMNTLPQNLHRKQEWTPWKARYFDHEKPINFKLLNWNDELKRIIPDLKFDVTSLYSEKDLGQLDYWAIKYFFCSQNFIGLTSKEFPSKDIVTVKFDDRKKSLNPTKKAIDSVIPKSTMATEVRVVSRREGKSNLSRTNSDLVVLNSIQHSNANISRRASNLVQEALSECVLNLKSPAELSASQKPKFIRQEKTKLSPLLGRQSQLKKVELSEFNDLIQASKADINIWKLDSLQTDESKKIIRYARIFYKEKFYRYEHLSNFLIRLKHFLLGLKDTNYSAFIFIDQNRNDRNQPVDIADLTVLGKQYLCLYDEFAHSNMEHKDLLQNAGLGYLGFISEIFTFNIDSIIPIKNIPIFMPQANGFNDLAKRVRVKLEKLESCFRNYDNFLDYLNPDRLEKIFEKKRIVLRFHLLNDIHITNKVYNELDFLGQAFSELTKSLESKSKGRLSKDIEYIKVSKHKFVGQKQVFFFDVLIFIEPQDNFNDTHKIIDEIRNHWDSAIKVVYRRTYKDEVGTIQTDGLIEQNLMNSIDSLRKTVLFIEKNNKNKINELKDLKTILLPYFIGHTIFLPWKKDKRYRQLSASQAFTKSIKNEKTTSRKDR